DLNGTFPLSRHHLHGCSGVGRMSYGNDYALDRGYERSESMSAERATFIRRTYGHLAGAILAFIGLETALLSIPGIELTVLRSVGGSPYSWLFVLGAFTLF